MYTPSVAVVYQYEVFPLLTSSDMHTVIVDVTAYGYPREAVAVELLLGCQSWDDGAYAVAYDGLTPSVGQIAALPTALIRNAWSMTRARVELEGSKFLLKVRPLGEPVTVIAVLKGYHTAA